MLKKYSTIFGIGSFRNWVMDCAWQTYTYLTIVVLNIACQKTTYQFLSYLWRYFLDTWNSPWNQWLFNLWSFRHHWSILRGKGSDCILDQLRQSILACLKVYVACFHNSRKPQIYFRLHQQILNLQFYRENIGIFSCLFPDSIPNSVINFSFGNSSNCGI